MKLQLGSTSEKFTNGLLSYLVLSAKSTPQLPFLTQSHPASSHVRGGVNGSVSIEASFRNTLYYPARSVVFNAYSSARYETQEDLYPIVDAMSHLSMDQEGDTSLAGSLFESIKRVALPHSTLILERTEPFGMSIVLNKDVPLYWFGLWNENHSLLVLTTISNLDSLLDRYYPNVWWVYRFQVSNSMFSVLYSRRICSRWYRWGTNAYTTNPFNRFAALERSLFRNGSFDMSSLGDESEPAE
jgi:hypothetical protein